MKNDIRIGKILLLVEEYIRLVYGTILLICGLILLFAFKSIVNAVAGQGANISGYTYNINKWVASAIIIYGGCFFIWCIINLIGLHKSTKKPNIRKGIAISSLIGAIFSLGLINIILAIVGTIMILKNNPIGQNYSNGQTQYMEQMPPQNYSQNPFLQSNVQNNQPNQNQNNQPNQNQNNQPNQNQNNQPNKNQNNQPNQNQNIQPNQT